MSEEDTLEVLVEILGYSYVALWSVGFYGQMYDNYKL